MECRDTRTGRSRGGRGVIVAGVAAIVATGVLGSGLLSAEEDDGPIDRARANLQDWVEVQTKISRERADWREGRVILEDRIELAQSVIDELEEGRQKAQAEIDKTEAKLVDLRARQAAFEADEEALAEVVAKLEARTRGLIARLPPPLQDRVAIYAKGIPDDPETTELGLDLRFMNLVGVLNTASKFHRDVSTDHPLQTLSDGSEAEVSALYLGLARAYYVSADGRFAGIGRAGAEAWEWSPANDAAAEIQTAIGILTEGKVAEYVDLPVRLDAEQGGQR